GQALADFLQMLAPAAVIVRPADGLERTQDAKMLYTKASCTGSSDTAVMEGGLDLLVRQPFEHEADHAEVDPGFAGGGQVLIVLAHPPVASDPGEGAFDDPASRPIRRFVSVMRSTLSGVLSCEAAPSRDGAVRREYRGRDALASAPAP